LIACASGYVATSDPASCCPVCKPISCDGACVIPACGPDSHLEQAPGQCCATCMPGTDDTACTTGRQQYDALRETLVEKYTAGGCKSDSDCTLVFSDNNCTIDCGVAVNAVLAMQATANLAGQAQAECGSCSPPIAPPCAPTTALCSNGKCVAGIAPTR
jgi:hypothetical protein